MFLARSTSFDSSLPVELPGFSPQRVARTLVSSDPARSPQEPSAPRTSLNIDLGGALQGAVAVADFFMKRAARRRLAERELPEKVLRLAAEHRGVVGVADLLLRLDCDRRQAERCLERLEEASLCRYLCQRQGEALYVFAGFLPRAWCCDYCLTRVEVSADAPRLALCQCENCGAAMSQKILLES